MNIEGVQLHVCATHAAVSAPHLGTMQLPPRLAQQSALVADLQANTDPGDAPTTPALAPLTAGQLLAWLRLNSRLLADAAAEASTSVDACSRLLESVTTNELDVVHRVHQAVQVRCRGAHPCLMVCMRSFARRSRCGVHMLPQVSEWA